MSRALFLSSDITLRWTDGGWYWLDWKGHSVDHSLEWAIMNLAHYINEYGLPAATGPEPDGGNYYRTAGEALDELRQSRGTYTLEEVEQAILSAPRKEKIILRNRAKCLNCGEILESTFTHHYVTCSCGSLSVDGGHDYIRRCFREDDCFEELSEERSGDLLSQAEVERMFGISPQDKAEIEVEFDDEE